MCVTRGLPLDAIDIDRKLCLTAAIVGARTRKDLAAAFRRVNPRTSFDVERANKWLQGRARPREQQVYEDWAKVLGEGHTGAWIAEADFDSFVDRICAAREADREALLRHAKAFGGDSPRAAPALAEEASPFATGLAGVYACYSHAWSPYFSGRMIRGALLIQPGAGGLEATYTQVRLADRLEGHGTVTILRRGLHIDMREPLERTSFHFTLFPPMSLVGVLGGLLCGTAVLGADPQPSVSRIVLVRLPGPSERLMSADCVLEPNASIAADLTAFGALTPDPAETDRRIAAFMSGGGGSCDRVTLDGFRPLVELFDRLWIAGGAAEGAAPD